MPHLEPLSTAPQGSPEWLAARNGGVGASEIAAVLGLSRYQSPLSVYRQKIGETQPDPDNWFMARGRALEPVLRQEYADRFQLSVQEVPGVLRHPVHHRILTSLDGIVLEPMKLTEFKVATSSAGWGEEGSDVVPEAYSVQVQQQMLVTDVPVADLFVSIGGKPPVRYTVEADREIQGMIVDAVEDFWEMVETRTEPDPSTISELLSRYSITEGAAVYATGEINGYIEQRAIKKADIKELEQAIGDAEEAIKKFLIESGASVILASDGRKLLTWNEQAGRTSIDTKALKSLHPAIYEEFAKEGKPFRVFR